MGNNKYSVKTGFNEFDELIQGCCSEELIIIAGRPTIYISFIILKSKLNFLRFNFTSLSFVSTLYTI